MLPKVLEDPEPEDSVDLTDEDVERSVATSSSQDWATRLAATVTTWSSRALRHEMRRRGDTFFIRTHVQTLDGAELVLIAQANWLGGGSS